MMSASVGVAAELKPLFPLCPCSQWLLLLLPGLFCSHLDLINVRGCLWSPSPVQVVEESSCWWFAEQHQYSFSVSSVMEACALKHAGLQVKYQQSAVEFY